MIDESASVVVGDGMENAGILMRSERTPEIYVSMRRRLDMDFNECVHVLLSKLDALMQPS